MSAVGPWGEALKVVQDAAYSAGIPPKWSDSWAVTHPNRYGVGPARFGYYSDSGEFHVIAEVESFDSLRRLAAMYPPVRRCHWCDGALAPKQRKFCSRECTAKGQAR